MCIWNKILLGRSSSPRWSFLLRCPAAEGSSRVARYICKHEAVIRKLRTTCAVGGVEEAVDAAKMNLRKARIELKNSSSAAASGASPFPTPRTPPAT